MVNDLAFKKIFSKPATYPGGEIKLQEDIENGYSYRNAYRTDAFLKKWSDGYGDRNFKNNVMRYMVNLAQSQNWKYGIGNDPSTKVYDKVLFNIGMERRTPCGEGGFLI